MTMLLRAHEEWCRFAPGHRYGSVESLLAAHREDFCGVVAGVLGLGTGWLPAPATIDGSRGLYVGGGELFVFLVQAGRSRGLFAWSTAPRSCGLTTFRYDRILADHRVVGAESVCETLIAETQMTIRKAGYAASFDLAGDPADLLDILARGAPRRTIH
ncbi:hypothetical protein GJ689_20090 [Rhodoplanes serenus]|jgi:hypothetical protein|uniref:Uncharacterized protein n=1 Tax=Rhodoplanes serenus TaxID=200615 RepID=A0A327K2Z4_9BRAD|nr:hypothetical protein [Rhodoplanes serenus]MBI5113228.1 hypothetical protein [Rhodovulum sp.]MTW18505.1 hypothetical protein [Rhodoplanes serenus]RAI32797.1 hypothetical protein CH340_14340 [Rhodoplanes serenus]VCU07663.1 hypothetical protein RHODGE_RHODGE_00868 [Rhodoplanes serenus]